MPIEGLTTRQVTNFGNHIPIIARLYKGAERTDEDMKAKRPGKELPHFRVKFEPEYTHLHTLWTEIHGDEPKELHNVFIGADTADTALSAFYREWGASGLIRECDGMNITRAYNTDDGRIVRLSHVPCMREHNGCQCKQEGTINLIFPAFLERAGVLGAVRFTTHSIEDIRSIYQALAVTQALYGKVFGVPFILYRKHEELAYFDKKDKKRKTMKKWFVKIRIDEHFIRNGLSHRLQSGTSAPQLPSASSMNGNHTDIPPLSYEDNATASRTWIATNGNKDKILAWAHGWFGMSSDEVLEAFRLDTPAVQHIQDYVGDADHIRACVIAWVAHGDLSMVYSTCAKADIVPPQTANTVKRLAEQLIGEWQSAYQPDEALDVELAE